MWNLKFQLILYTLTINIITTNKAIATLDLNIIEKYIKKLNNINSNNVMSS